ncbi:hypothetical protein HDU92_008905 [Lobulomyces angularis]|nr:hypothetical protein HDU92_008905 [Lobulomyces angularis]
MPWVWFQLVDSEGNPYNKISPSSVLVQQDTNIDNLKSLIKVELSHNLSHVDAVDLKIYESVDNLEIHPIAVDAPVTGLGNTLATKLFVVVPSDDKPAPLLKNWSFEIWEKPRVVENLEEKFKFIEVDVNKILFTVDGIKRHPENLPHLLIDDLGTVQSKCLESLSSCVANPKNRVTFILGSSGCGKTRTIFEYLYQHYGIFLTYKNSGTQLPGSMDLNYVIERIQQFKKGDVYENQEYLAHLVKCLVAARLYMFKKIYESVKITKETWLFIQLFPKRYSNTDEFFETIIQIFRHLKSQDLEAMLNGLIEYFKKVSGNIPIFLDEAQALIDTEFDKFPSNSDALKRCSLLNAIKNAILAIDTDIVLIPTGTGLSITDISGDNAKVSGFMKSSTAKVLPAICIVDNCWENIDEIQDFLSQYLGEKFKLFPEHALYFIGRVRPLALFIEFCLVNRTKERNFDVNENFKLFVNEVTASNREVWSVYRLFEEERLKNNSLLPLLKKCVFFKVCFDRPFTMLVSEDARLFERAFGILRKVEEESNELFVTVKELFVLHSAYNYFFKKNKNFLDEMAQIRIAESFNPQSRGYLWEVCI